MKTLAISEWLLTIRAVTIKVFSGVISDSEINFRFLTLDTSRILISNCKTAGPLAKQWSLNNTTEFSGFRGCNLPSFDHWQRLPRKMAGKTVHIDIYYTCIYKSLIHSSNVFYFWKLRWNSCCITIPYWAYKRLLKLTMHLLLTLSTYRCVEGTETACESDEGLSWG